MSGHLTSKRKRETMVTPHGRREPSNAVVFPNRPNITLMEVTALMVATIAIAIALAVFVNQYRRDEPASAAISLSKTAKVTVDGRKLENQIRQRLAETPELAGAAIRAKVNAGQVTLSGQVKHPAMKALAEQLVKQLPGVTSIVNELTLA